MRNNYLFETLTALVFNSSPLKSHDEWLLSAFNDSDLRHRLRLMSVFGQREAEDLTGLAGAFHRGGNKKTTSRLDHDRAVVVSAFLEAPIPILMTSRIRHAPKGEQLWYNHAPEVTKADFHISDFEDKDAFVYGVMFLDDLSLNVGVTGLYLPGMVQISFWLDKNFHVSQSDWDFRLILFGANCGIGGDKPSVFTVASPHLSTGPERIYRMIWVYDNDPQTLVRLYARIFTPRVEEVTICTAADRKTYKKPLFKNHEIIPLLKRTFDPENHNKVGRIIV